MNEFKAVVDIRTFLCNSRKREVHWFSRRSSNPGVHWFSWRSSSPGVHQQFSHKFCACFSPPPTLYCCARLWFEEEWQYSLHKCNIT